MNRCRWDREQEMYLRDGEPCKVDDYGDPTHHCTARRSCGNHIGRGELTCARCIGRVRSVIRRIVELAPLALTRAIAAGVESDAANLAGPAADPRRWSDRRIAMNAHLLTWERLGRITEAQYGRAKGNMADDDDQHPYVVLTRWHMMFAEDYNHRLPDVMSISDSGAYLERVLHVVAQDPEQDFPLLRNETRKVLDHLEAVLQNSMKPERGAPCPECRDEGRVLRLSREYPHWCDDEDCERMHYADDSEDRWTCPRGHSRSHEDYQRWIEERKDVGA